MRKRSCHAAAAALVTVLTSVMALSGCSVFQKESTGLVGALEQTPAGIGAEQEFYYSDITAAYALGTFTDRQPYAQAGAYGLGQLSNLVKVLPEYIPVQGAEGASAITVGRPPDTSFRFVGVDPTAVEGKLGGAKGHRSELAGGTLLVQREDHAMDLEDENARYLQSVMNTVWYSDDVLVGSSTQADARAWVDPDESLADAGIYSGVESCLGDNVLGATLSADAETLPSSINTFAAATTGTSETDWTDVLCVRGENADQLLEAARSGVVEGTSAQSARPWSDLLGEAVVEAADDGWVRISTTERPGVFVDAYRVQDLGSLLGGS